MRKLRSGLTTLIMKLLTVNLRGFHTSVNPRFEGVIPDFMDGITDFMGNFNTF